MRSTIYNIPTTYIFKVYDQCNINIRLVTIKTIINIVIKYISIFCESSIILHLFNLLGFKDVQSACCGRGRLNGEKPCFLLDEPNLCSNRHEFLFWDFFHPTEFASQLAARTLYGAGTRFVTPMNFSQLVAINVWYQFSHSTRINWSVFNQPAIPYRTLIYSCIQNKLNLWCFLCYGILIHAWIKASYTSY